MAGLLDYITEAAKAQYAKGAPYRNALGGLLSGDMTALQELNKPSPVMPNEALDVAMAFAPMGITKAVGGKFPLTDFEVKQLTAQRNATLPVAEGGLGLPASNTSMDRAKAMGFDTPAYHATNSDIKAFIPSDVGTYGSGVYTAKHPEVAEGYFQDISNSNTLPLLINKGKEKQFASFSDYVGQKGKARNTFDYGKDLRNEGYNSLNVKFFPEGEVREYASFNPSDIRSRFAAFDPFKRNEADILAGVGVGVPVASGLLDIEDKKVPKKEKKKTK
jgi:hypothetical protein